ncbi:hypothetical protein [Roseiconus lacunae]|uniref:Uncharacterized protein n=1 Tax=Roseiconus lacunae TaxID=2605694 RepID=A0ABT7PEH0_9BACT|nr:hypothetical protein [Roseiconus lacunae]MDM4014883.1 hypothetical protein [Roseiconus lacunae]
MSSTKTEALALGIAARVQAEREKQEAADRAHATKEWQELTDTVLADAMGYEIDAASLAELCTECNVGVSHLRNLRERAGEALRALDLLPFEAEARRRSLDVRTHWKAFDRAAENTRRLVNLLAGSVQTDLSRVLRSEGDLRNISRHAASFFNDDLDPKSLRVKEAKKGRKLLQACEKATACGAPLTPDLRAELREHLRVLTKEARWLVDFLAEGKPQRSAAKAERQPEEPAAQ